MLGLLGSHRTGKSTLALAIADRLKLTFAETNVSAIIADLGFDPRQTLGIEDRLRVQRTVLERTVNEVYKKAPGNAVTDRTPLDMLGYTLADIQGSTLQPTQEFELQAYTIECFAAANDYFTALVLIQPGIPVIDAPGKAMPSAGYMDHLNALMMGLMLDDRLDTRHYFMPRSVLDLPQRVKALEQVWGRALEGVQLLRNETKLSSASSSALH